MRNGIRIGIIALVAVLGLARCAEQIEDDSTVNRGFPTAYNQEVEVLQAKNGTKYLRSCVRQNGSKLMNLRETGQTQAAQNLLASCAISESTVTSEQRARLFHRGAHGDFSTYVLYLDKAWNKQNHRYLCTYFFNVDCNSYDWSWYSYFFYYDYPTYYNPPVTSCYTDCLYARNYNRCLRNRGCGYTWTIF